MRVLRCCWQLSPESAWGYLYDVAVFVVAVPLYLLAQPAEDFWVAAGLVHVVVGEEDFGLDVFADVEHAIIRYCPIASSYYRPDL
jgi:hypothetical protein